MNPSDHAPKSSCRRLVLTAEQSAALADKARFSFVIIHPGSWPETPGRMVLDLIEIDQPTGDALCRVAMGTHRAVKKPPSVS